ncbi:hypothetical protein ASE43_17070 [Lysobacter sp. Root983]|nr:hypothetical protein ASE35_00755 [Lysobacter sp. Root916]KRD74907.1 hypothetical protein ASE43_17070 [Lysobacter sp. Root983]
MCGCIAQVLIEQLRSLTDRIDMLVMLQDFEVPASQPSERAWCGQGLEIGGTQRCAGSGVESGAYRAPADVSLSAPAPCRRVYTSCAVRQRRYYFG